MTDYLIVTADPDPEPGPEPVRLGDRPGAPDAPDGATLRRLLRGTVFDPRTGRAADDRPEPAGEHRRTPAAHCRFAVHYED